MIDAFNILDDQKKREKEIAELKEKISRKNIVSEQPFAPTQIPKQAEQPFQVQPLRINLPQDNIRRQENDNTPIPPLRLQTVIVPESKKEDVSDVYKLTISKRLEEPEKIEQKKEPDIVLPKEVSESKIKIPNFEHTPDVVKKELDRIDETIADMTVSSVDLAVQIPFARNLGGGGGLDFTKISLGYKFNPAGDDPDLMRIYAGEIDRVAVAQADVTVADNNYIYVRRTRADDTMLVTAAASVPANDATYKYYRLYRVTVTGGVASIQNIYRPFDIEVEEKELPTTATQYQVLAWSGTAWAADWVRATA